MEEHLLTTVSDPQRSFVCFVAALKRGIANLDNIGDVDKLVFTLCPRALHDKPVHREALRFIGSQRVMEAALVDNARKLTCRSEGAAACCCRQCQSYFKYK